MKGLQHFIMPLTPELDNLGRLELDAPKYQAPHNAALISMSRQGFAYVARRLMDTHRRVMVPAYTCATVAFPFTREGWDCQYYAINTDLRIDIPAFEAQLESFRPDVIVVHPYYGQDLCEEERVLLRKAKAQGCIIVKDLTQCIGAAQKEDFVDVYTGSLRKWFPIPDGAFYYSQLLPMDSSIFPEDTEFVAAFRDAMYANYFFTLTADPVILGVACRIDKHLGQGKRRGEAIQICRMSDFSRRILYTQDFESYNQRRLENARYLWEKLKDNPMCKMVYKDISQLTTGPLFFPVYVEDSKGFCNDVLRPAGIRGVRMWCEYLDSIPAELKERTAPLYHNMVQLPVGLDYGKEEMDRIVACFQTTP